MKATRILTVVSMLICSMNISAIRAQAATLPPPGGTFDGVPYSFQFDDFWSYSAKIMDALQTEGYMPLSYGNFDFATGTGGLDVILYTGAGTKKRNLLVGPDGPDPGNKGDFNFEDPTAAPSGNQATSFNGWWGQNDQNNDGTVDNVNGPVTVGQVLSYLQAFDPNNSIPVFYFDNNQQGSAASLLASMRVSLVDPTNGNTVAFWALDSIDNNAYDPNAPVLAAGEVTFVGESGTVYTVNHNIGSGKPDFIFYAPTMDLGLYSSNLLFVVEGHLSNLEGGFEEAFLTGAITPGSYPVPEPSTLLLLGAGLAGLGLLGRKRSQS